MKLMDPVVEKFSGKSASDRLQMNETSGKIFFDKDPLNLPSWLTPSQIDEIQDVKKRLEALPEESGAQIIPATPDGTNNSSPLTSIYSTSYIANTPDDSSNSSSLTRSYSVSDIVNTSASEVSQRGAHDVSDDIRTQTQNRAVIDPQFTMDDLTGQEFEYLFPDTENVDDTNPDRISGSETPDSARRTPSLTIDNLINEIDNASSLRSEPDFQHNRNLREVTNDVIATPDGANNSSPLTSRYSTLDITNTPDVAGNPENNAVELTKSDKSWRALGHAMRWSGVAMDLTGGALDIWLGSERVKSGNENNIPLETATGGVQIAAGSASVLAGGSGAIGAAGILSSATWITAASGAFFWTGAVLGGAGLVLDAILNVYKHNEMMKQTNAEGQWFHDLAADGLMKDEWGNKLEYMRATVRENEGRGAPDDVSILDHYEQEYRQEHPYTSNELKKVLIEPGEYTEEDFA